MDKNQRLILEEIQKENLCTYFILPLLKLNKESFASESNFIDSYLSKDLRSILVKVFDVQFFKHRMDEHPDFKSILKSKSGTLYVHYYIPLVWRRDVLAFSEGRYSELSQEAKDLIRSTSGLTYRVVPEGYSIPVTDVRLLALDKDEAVKDMWEAITDVQISPDQELLSKPDENSFIDIDDLEVVLK
jgi:hypothetical protein